MRKYFKKVSIFMFTAILLLTSLPVLAAEPTLEITVPDVNTTMAGDRSYSVYGSIDAPDGLPEDASIVITLNDADGQEVRRVGTTIQSNTDMNTAYFDTNPGYYYDSTDPGRQKLADSGMPALVGTENYEDGSQKCWFNSTDFYALIIGSTHGTVDDQMNFVDADGNDYKAFPDGEYTIKVTLFDGETEISSTSKNITIGETSDKVLARFGPKAQSDKINEFANTNGYTVFSDPFPGYWDNKKTGVFAEILPLWRASDITEYLTGTTHCVLYNFKASSTAYSVELGSLQSQQVIDDTERVIFYTYDTGEPSLTLTDGSTIDGNITKVNDSDKIVVTRCDTVDDPSKSEDNVLNLFDSNISAADTNVDDGIIALPGQTISINGVVVPIQNTPEQVVDNGDNSYTVTNKINTLHYSITGDGVNVEEDKPVTVLNRIYEEGYESPSEVEFKHDFTITEDMAGKKLTMTITGYDVNGTVVPGTQKTIVLNEAGTETQTSEAVQTKTSGVNSIMVIVILLLLAVVLFGIIRMKKRK